MGRTSNHNVTEWSFIALLLAACAVLTGLQYHWTGAVSRAEAASLRDGLAGGVQQFGNTFDAVLTENCSALVPRGKMINDENRAKIHEQLLAKWKAANPRPLFSRLAVAVPAADGIDLFELNLTNGNFAPATWPLSWRSLRQNLSRRNEGGAPPSENLKGTLIEFPIFNTNSDDDGPPDDGGPPDDMGPPDNMEPPDNGGRHGNVGPPHDAGPPDNAGPPPGMGRPGPGEWMILELDTNYLQKVWFPELAQRYLNFSGEAVNDVVVRSLPPAGEIIYSTRTNGVGNAEAPVVMHFNRQGRSSEPAHGPTPNFRWNLEVRPRPGALEGIVASSRQRNLTLALLMNALILVTGLALVRHTRRSRQLAEAQMNFVANVSHELRTPLTVIRGAAHNLNRGVVQERSQIERYSGLIIQHAEQLGEMVEQVLQLAGAKKNQSAAVRQPVALVEVLNEAMAATVHDVEAAHCTLQLELPPSLPAVTGDAAALRRAFQNLITNAAKHGGAGGWIGVTAVTDENANEPTVEIQVADRGAGIPPSELSDIFKPFFRGRLAQTRQIRGSGLGLSLVREIIEAHGGSIAVRSEGGGGTTFIIRLPASVAETNQ